jgi:hypothetical protein
MVAIFSGDWIIEVVEKRADFSQRFIVEGSAGSDGVYPGETATPPVKVSGSRWLIRFEWSNNSGSSWQPSQLRRTGAEYTLDTGLTVFLGADDNWDLLRDKDFDDVVLRCRNTDRQRNPWHPFKNPYNFTLPRDVRQRSRAKEPIKSSPDSN